MGLRCLNSAVPAQPGLSAGGAALPAPGVTRGDAPHAAGRAAPNAPPRPAPHAAPPRPRCQRAPPLPSAPLPSPPAAHLARWEGAALYPGRSGRGCVGAGAERLQCRYRAEPRISALSVLLFQFFRLSPLALVVVALSFFRPFPLSSSAVLGCCFPPPLCRERLSAPLRPAERSGRCLFAARGVRDRNRCALGPRSSSAVRCQRVSALLWCRRRRSGQGLRGSRAGGCRLHPPRTGSGCEEG